MKEAFVGFDSAWAGNRVGAISYAVFQEGNLARMSLPRVADFADAAKSVEKLQGECDDVLVAIDQPIIVNNATRSRPVDRVAGALMTRLGSGALPANRNQATMFGDDAPIWRFINRIMGPGMTRPALTDFAAARNATGTTRLIEVYPALALPAMCQTFMNRESAARYDPEKDNFAQGDWQLVCETVRDYANNLKLQSLAGWASEMITPWDSPKKPKKPHQDKIDSAICLIICLQWRQARNSNVLHAFGDINDGYMVTPMSDATRKILEQACTDRNVNFH